MTIQLCILLKMRQEEALRVFSDVSETILILDDSKYQ